MKLLLVLLLAFDLACVSMTKVHGNNTISETMQKVFGFKPPSRSEVKEADHGSTFEITGIEGIELGQGVTFNVVNVAKKFIIKFVGEAAFPYLPFLSNVIEFFKLGFNGGELSIWDQIKDKVEQEIVNGISDYHKNVLYVKLKSIESRFNSLHGTTRLNFSSLKKKLLALSEHIFHERHVFFPTNFEGSIQYDASVIVCMTKVAAYYMSATIMIESFYVDNSLAVDDDLNEVRDHSKKFWLDCREAAYKTVVWALDNRAEKFEIDVGSKYGILDTMNKTVYQLRGLSRKLTVEGETLFIGKFANLVRQVRSEVRSTLNDILIDPINVFLNHLGLPSVQEFVDGRRYPMTIRGRPCDSPCSMVGQNFFWCATNEKQWDYCSPLDDARTEVTYKNERCLYKCDRDPGERRYRCPTSARLDYCSPSKSRWHIPKWYKFDQLTISGVLCHSPCTRTHKGFGYCYKETSHFMKWDYCSAEDGKTYQGKICTSICKKSGKSSYCTTSNSWDYCSTRDSIGTLQSSIRDRYKNMPSKADYFFDIYSLS